MTLKNLFICLLPFLFSGCLQKRPAEITISFKGNAKDSILYVYRPVNDCYFPECVDTLPGRADSTYTLSVPVDKTATVWLRSNTCYVPLLVAPGYKLHFDYDLYGSDTSCPVTGTGGEGQRLYGRMMAGKDEYRYEWIRDYSQAPLDTLPEKMWRQFTELANREIAPFDSLYKTGEIDREFLRQVTNDIRYYYAMSVSKIIRNNYLREIDRNIPMYRGYRELWKQIYSEYPLTEEAMRSKWFHTYADLYRTYRAVGEGKDPYPRSYAATYDACGNYFENPVKEYALAFRLCYEGLNNKSYDETILPVFDRFKNEYPDSPYSRYFTPYIFAVTDFNAKTKGDFPSDVAFVEAPEKIHTFKDLLSKFEGQPLFIDFWFAQCGACKEQFAFNAPLKKFLKENGITMLYVSIDREPTYELWKKYIKYFNLSGWHLCTSPLLHKDLDEHYGVHLYPRYMVADKNGNIVVASARQPEEGQALFDQISEALK